MGQIGFHLTSENPRLTAHWARVSRPDARVLVPLCGKSVDLAWLASRGHDVVGVELSETAARAFFEERGIEPEVVETPSFRLFRADRVTIAVGDFFAAMPETLSGSFDLAYDRAALIALPPELRERYVSTLRGLLAANGRVLLVTIDFDAPGGPPFSVDEDAVRALYADARVELVERADALDSSANLTARGATRVDELVFVVDPTSSVGGTNP